MLEELKSLNRDELTKLVEVLLLNFDKYVLWIHKLAQGSVYDMTDSHRALCKKLQQYAEGKNVKRNLMVNVSPGFGKSLLLQYFITWCFARSKHCMFCYIAYGERLIKKLSRESRNLMMMPEWEFLFGKEMDPGDKSILNYHLLSGGVRSGLTAGTISSAILGLDAGNPASPDEEFTGALLLDDINSPEVRTSLHEQYEVPETYQRKLATRRRTPKVPTICIMQRHCFTPETLVWTEHGKKTIQEIVESRYSGKVWSFNPVSKKFELKEITDYIKNEESVQEIFNISGIKCTGQHRVCTQRGVVLARDLKIGDQIIGTANTLDNSSRDSEFLCKLLLPIICCANFFNFVFGKVSNWFKAAFRDTSSSSVTTAVFNSNDSAIWNRVFRDKFFNRHRVFCNLFSKFWGKFCHITNKGKMAILFGILVVFPIRSILKVIKSVIGWVIIKMAHNTTCRSWANKCFKNKLMNSINFMITTFAKRYLGISTIFGISDKTVTNDTKHPSKIRNSVKAFIANNISENFVHTITSIKKSKIKTATYCITVQDNHTLIVGTSQGFIFGNCENDFAGWVEQNEADEWEFFIVPALNEQGESYYPKRYPKEELERLQKQNPYLFAAMYMQKPLSNQGLYFHEEWIRSYRTIPEKFKKMFITTDFGFTTNGDKSLFCCWGLAADENLYLLRSLQGKWESPDAKKHCIDFFNRCSSAFSMCRRVYVEQTLSGIGFIQDMKRENPKMAIIPLRRGAKKNKLNRAESASTWMEGGRVYFREGDPNFVLMRAEVLSYNPNDKNPHDEWIDNIGDACEISFNMKTSSIFV